MVQLDEVAGITGEQAEVGVVGNVGALVQDLIGIRVGATPGIEPA